MLLMKRKKSAINWQNKAAQKTNHCSGTKSFARVSRELVYTTYVSISNILFSVVIRVLKCFIGNYLYGIVGGGKGQCG